MRENLTGKVALVTGGSRGIGAAAARALTDDGAAVAISSVASAGKAEAIVQELQANGFRAAAFKADQADPAQVAFVASPGASYITGTVLNVDGGFGA